MMLDQLSRLTRLTAALDAQMTMGNGQTTELTTNRDAFGRCVRGFRLTHQQLHLRGGSDSPAANVPGSSEDSRDPVFQLKRYQASPLTRLDKFDQSDSSGADGYCVVDATRLHNTMIMLNKSIPKLIQKISQITLNRNLSTLSEQIQRCCFNCIYVQDLLKLDKPLSNGCNVKTLERWMLQLDDQLVECLLSYQPDSEDEQQELFAMCIWYMNLLLISERSQSANILVISRKLATLLQDGSIQSIDKERARLRISNTFSTDDPPMDDERLSRIIFGEIASALKNIRCLSLDSAKCEKLLNIVEQLFTTDPLFQLKQNAEDLHTEWQELKENLVSLTKFMTQKLNAKRLDFINDGTFNECDMLLSMFCCLGFWPSALCSPDIGLIALSRLYQHRSLSSVKVLLTKIQEVICEGNQENSALYALMAFLLDNPSEDNFTKVKNNDLRYYLKSLIFYLDRREDDALSQAGLSRLPEAFWLLGKIHRDKGELTQAIASTQSAIIRGVEAGKLELALMLLTFPEPDQLKISGLLNDVMEHYGNLGAIKLQIELAEIRDSLELTATEKALANPPTLNDDWLLSDEKPKRSSAVAHRNRTKGKRYKLKRSGPGPGKGECAASNASHKTGRVDQAGDAENQPSVAISPAVVAQSQTRWLSRYDMAILSLSVTHAISCRGYDYAYQQLLAANEKIDWDFQRATIARMDLWRLRELANDRQHLQLLSQSVQAGEKTFEFSVIPQSSTLLDPFGLTRNESITLAADACVTRDALRTLAIDKALGWLCFLHCEPLTMGELKQRWQDHPLETAKQQLKDFEHSLSIAFTTASFLSTLGHLHGDIARDRADGNEERRRIKTLAAAFYEAANQFNEWRSRLKNDGVLNNRIARATPLGNLQKIRTMQVRQGKMANQPPP
ncbi:hypothetical protein [Endozoicomonas sp. ONNA2]|uniref:hypothetical protein n=1 Tax=Endozoicomonas sp. ONNA2 TaxID=2828741 RepID=UPI002147D398|nr:hypothetical protein [Endozoicomonas sp. ONNA2]